MFEDIPPPTVDEEPSWYIDELTDKITNLEEEYDFIQLEMSKFVEEEQVYMAKKTSIEQQLESVTSEFEKAQAEKISIQQQLESITSEFEKLIQLQTDYKSKLTGIEDQLEKTKAEKESTQTLGTHLTSLPLPTAANTFGIFADDTESPVSLMPDQSKEKAASIDQSLTISKGKKKKEGAAEENALIEDAIAASKLPKDVSDDYINISNKPYTKFVEKEEPKSTDRYYVHFLSKDDYEKCVQTLVSEDPSYTANLNKLYSMSGRAGTILSKSKFDEYSSYQNIVFYAVISSYINLHINRKKLNLNIFYWLLYLINAFKNVTPLCEINDTYLAKFPYKDLPPSLEILYIYLRIYCSFFSNNMLESNSNNFMQTPLNTYVYLFVSFNNLFKHYNDGSISNIKKTLMKCISNIQERQKLPFNPVTFFPDMKNPIFVFDASILQTPLFNDSMNEKQQQTIAKLTHLEQTSEYTPETHAILCDARNKIINEYIQTLLELSTSEINELIKRKENNTLFIKKIMLIFYNLMYTSMSPDDYIFNQENMTVISTPFKMAITKFLTQLKTTIETKSFTGNEHEIYLTYNQLYSFINIYFYPIRINWYDAIFIESSDYIFEHDL